MSAGSDLSRRPEETSQRGSRREESELMRMLLKLFSLYPPRPDAEMTIAAYMEELRDLPSLLISHALHRLVRRKGEFAPNVATIRRECAHLVRERQRAANGLEPTGGLDGEIDAEKWLQRAQDPLPALPAGRTLELAAGPQEREEARRKLQMEIDRLEGRMKARQA